MTLHRKGPQTLDLDMAWAKKQLLDGRMVWCIRTKLGGLIVTMLSLPPTGDSRLDTWRTFDGHPLDDFTVTPITLVENEPKMGIEEDWPHARFRPDEPSGQLLN